MSIPRRLGILATVGIAGLVVPVVGLIVRTSWGRVLSDIGDASSAVRVSLVVSVIAVTLAVLTGVPIGWVLARGRFRGRTVLRAAVLLPIVLPPVVSGVALLAALGRNGSFGRWLDGAFSIGLPFTTAGAVVAAAFVAIPFVALVAEAGFRGVDAELEGVAATLGAGPWRRFRRIVLPQAAPALAAGIVLGWARAVGEFGATITFAGNLPGRTQTLPLAIFFELEQDPAAAFSLSFVLVVISLGMLLAARRAWMR
ncbi:MAG: molybdate ABC transporter permease subunit [Acidimicrobiia bacterium]|nr:molybdate ABC transporter permease subunit [Acidimicrobiia bacterium]NNF10429.1 molybdate ABC transporter permease subunit [Acidimicrobiia bacterium]